MTFKLRALLEKLLPVGRRSLLWGVHQFLWHPITVARAWIALYGRWPTWREAVCIVIHDWGYWFTSNMDGEEGERHPEFGARIAGRLFGRKYHDLVLYHSRHYVKRENERRTRWAELKNACLAAIGKTSIRMEPAMVKPSPLCWADKLSICYDPPWFYLLRARLSGEIKEYRQNRPETG